MLNNDWFNLTWWREEGWNEYAHFIYEGIDLFFFFLFLFAVLYLFIFALFALRKRQETYPTAKKKNRFVVLFPAYMEDEVIVSSAKDFFNQNYPADKYDVIVISDNMEDATNQQLEQLPVKVLKVNFENSTKTQALQYAMSNLDPKAYDIVVLLDADNVVDPDFLEKINDAYYSGGMAIQTHRVAKNLNTNTAILDAVSEEINNSIFRKGHVRLGFSSALIGSGMAFGYNWFKENIYKAANVGIDKQLEILLLKQGVFIEYLENVYTYDEKVQNSATFYKQRRRWLANQTTSLTNSYRDFPAAFFAWNLDYCDKLLQWMMPSRVLLLGYITIISSALCFLDWTLSIKWWAILGLLLITFSMAVPDHLVNSKFKKALKMAPLLFIMMVANHFRLRGASKKFIHTKHGETKE